MKTILAAALAFAIVAPATASAASFNYFGTVTLTGDIAALSPSLAPFGDSDFGTSGNATATASFDLIEALPAITLSVSGSGDAEGMPFGSAFAFAFSSIDIELTNGTDADIVLPFTLSWDLTVSSTGLTMFGEADSQLGFFASFDDSAPITLFDEVLSATPGGTFPLIGSLGFDATIRANDFATIQLALEGEGFATSVAPVPLPAGLPLLAVGLGALALLRRRAA